MCDSWQILCVYENSEAERLQYFIFGALFVYFDGLVQGYCNPIANALELQ